MRLVSLHHYGFQVVGFDCEWVFWGQRLPVALIQIATYNGLCVLVRIFQITDSIPVSLKKFLADKRFVYVGLFGLQCEKTCLQGFANNTGADQPAHPRSLISTFVISLFGEYLGKLAIDEISIF